MDLVAPVISKTLLMVVPLDSLTFWLYGERGRTGQDVGLLMKKWLWGAR